jgi:hypothetical protein
VVGLCLAMMVAEEFFVSDCWSENTRRKSALSGESDFLCSVVYTSLLCFTIGLDKRHADSALEACAAGSKSKLSPYQSPMILSIITILLPPTSRRLIGRSTLTVVVVFGAVWVAVVEAS